MKWQHKPASHVLQKYFNNFSFKCLWRTPYLTPSKPSLKSDSHCPNSTHSDHLPSLHIVSAQHSLVFLLLANHNRLSPSAKLLLPTPPENSRFLPSPSPGMPNYGWRSIFSGHTLNMISKLRHFTVRTHYILYVHLIFQSKSYLLFSSSHYSVAYQADFTFLMLLFSFMLHIHTVLRWQNIHLLLHC